MNKYVVLPVMAAMVSFSAAAQQRLPAAAPPAQQTPTIIGYCMEPDGTIRGAAGNAVRFVTQYSDGTVVVSSAFAAYKDDPKKWTRTQPFRVPGEGAVFNSTLSPQAFKLTPTSNGYSLANVGGSYYVTIACSAQVPQEALANIKAGLSP